VSPPPSETVSNARQVDYERSAARRLCRPAAGLTAEDLPQLRDLIHQADRELTETIKRGVHPYFVLDGNVCARLSGFGSRGSSSLLTMLPPARASSRPYNLSLAQDPTVEQPMRRPPARDRLP